MTNIFIDSWDCTPTIKVDKRTRKGREEEILAAIKQFKRLSVFWITEFQTRACAMERLIKSKRVKARKEGFPWTRFYLI